MSKMHTDGRPDPAIAKANAAKRAELAANTASSGGKCSVCGNPSGRGRYGYPTSDCGSQDCRDELRRRRRARLERNLKPSTGGTDWKPGIPGQGGREHR